MIKHQKNIFLKLLFLGLLIKFNMVVSKASAHEIYSGIILQCSSTRPAILTDKGVSKDIPFKISATVDLNLASKVACVEHNHEQPFPKQMEKMEIPDVCAKLEVSDNQFKIVSETPGNVEDYKFPEVIEILGGIFNKKTVLIDRYRASMNYSIETRVGDSEPQSKLEFLLHCEKIEEFEIEQKF